MIRSVKLCKQFCQQQNTCSIEFSQTPSNHTPHPYNPTPYPYPSSLTPHTTHTHYTLHILISQTITYCIPPLGSTHILLSPTPHHTHTFIPPPHTPSPPTPHTPSPLTLLPGLGRFVEVRVHTPSSSHLGGQ